MASLLSHLSLAVCPVAGVFNLDYPSPSASPFYPAPNRLPRRDSVVAIEAAPLTGRLRGGDGGKLPSLGITGGDNAILLLANCDARKTALLPYEYSAAVAGA